MYLNYGCGHITYLPMVNLATSLAGLQKKTGPIHESPAHQWQRAYLLRRPPSWPTREFSYAVG